jgi:DNA (cytosine-5)-methyltransferase 1
MPWASWNGCREAVPPAYTEFIGAQLLAHVQQVAA